LAIIAQHLIYIIGIVLVAWSNFVYVEDLFVECRELQLICDGGFL